MANRIIRYILNEDNEQHLIYKDDYSLPHPDNHMKYVAELKNLELSKEVRLYDRRGSRGNVKLYDYTIVNIRTNDGYLDVIIEPKELLWTNDNGKSFRF